MNGCGNKIVDFLFNLLKQILISWYIYMAQTTQIRYNIHKVFRRYNIQYLDRERNETQTTWN